jgi:phytoene/squalene synthetase
MGTLERSDQGSALVRREDFGLATSPAEEVAIAQRIRGASASFFWSTRLLPGPRRNAMQALYGSCREFGDIAVGEALRTLNLLAEWSAEITLLYAGRPQHVITRALRDAVERFDLRYGDFLAIIDGRKMDSGTDIRAPSFEQLDLYCEQRVVAVNRIAFRILGAAPLDADRVAAALGRGMLLTSILRDLAWNAASWLKVSCHPSPLAIGA